MSIAMIFRGQQCVPFEPPPIAGKADTKAFAQWLWKVGERDAMPWGRLANLYAEYCWMEGLEPLPARSLQYQLGKAGIVGRRPNYGGKKKKALKPNEAQRPTLYRIEAAKMATAHVRRAA